MAQLLELKQCVSSENYKYISLSLMSTLLVPTILGNMLIIICVIKFRFLKGFPIYTFIFNMSISNLLMGFAMTMTPLEHIFTILSSNIYFCSIRMAVLAVTIITSIWLTTFISIDRYLAVCHPFKHRIEAKKKYKFIIGCFVLWIFAIINGGVKTNIDMNEMES